MPFPKLSCAGQCCHRRSGRRAASRTRRLNRAIRLPRRRCGSEYEGGSDGIRFAFSIARCERTTLFAAQCGHREVLLACSGIAAQLQLIVKSRGLLACPALSVTTTRNLTKYDVGPHVQVLRLVAPDFCSSGAAFKATEVTVRSFALVPNTWRLTNTASPSGSVYEMFCSTSKMEPALPIFVRRTSVMTGAERFLSAAAVTFSLRGSTRTCSETVHVAAAVAAQAAMVINAGLSFSDIAPAEE